jgi:hypothetical protein
MGGAMTCQPITCTTAAGCSNGDLCCAGFGGGMMATCRTPGMGGTCPGGSAPVCTTTAECNNPNQVCAAAAGAGDAGTLMTCQAAPCTSAANCSNGDLCCMGGFGGGMAATCRTPNMMGACPGGSMPVGDAGGMPPTDAGTGG